MKLKVITRKPEVKTKKTPLLFVHGICHAACLCKPDKISSAPTS